MVGLMFLTLLSGALTSGAQPFTTLYSFGTGPANPRANLTPGPGGFFYGTAATGGQYGDGAVFRVSTNGNLMTLASFGSFLKDGTWPYAGLTPGADGNFYGTTIAGGTNQISGTNNTGTIFRVTTNGTLTTVASFAGLNGSYPECKLTIGPNGSFYGTTAYGGISNVGTVFQATTNGIITTLASFQGTNGAMPQAGLTLALDGNFYGTTTYGGISNAGTVFQVTPGGALKTLAVFTNLNGAQPYGQLTLGSDGDLYGTTSSGDANTGPFQFSTNSSLGISGTVFRITTNGTLTTLADLSMYEDYGGIYPGLESVGHNPYGQLLQGRDGYFYGTTAGGGTNGTGTIFKVSTNTILDQLSTLPNFQYQLLTNFLGFIYVNYTTNNWTNSSLVLRLNASVKKVYDFPPLVNSTNSTGAESRAGLTLGADGNFYTAVFAGGASGYGTIIRVSTNGIATVLASFSGNTGNGIRAGLTLGPDGGLYGAAQSGGVNNIGTLFKWLPDGSLSTLHHFDYRPDGANPNASLTLGPDGNLYGTTMNGGTNLIQVGPNSYNAVSDGTVFRVTTNGVFTPVFYFNGTNGANPYGSLTLLADGKFYGTTAYGGISNSGTVFQMTTNGTLTVLDSFTGANGSHPDCKLALGPDGNLYGTTFFGGVSNVGTVFQISTQGTINTLLHFTGTNGANPEAGLLWNSDGFFYGTTESGGSKHLGTLFKVTTAGALTTLMNFAQTNGDFPDGDLIKGPDGYIYGATPQGGTGFNGSVFRLSASGTLTTLFSFPSTPLNASFSSGYRPYSGLLLYTNGHFIHLYGTAYGGGNNGGGTIFQVNSSTSYAVTENASTLLNPLTNDTVWTTGGSLTLADTSTTNGTANINGAKILVLPATNFTGSVTLSYTFTDGLQTNTSLITLLVTNIPPQANPDSYSVVANSSSDVLSPLVNDLPLTGGGILSLLSVSPTNGTAIISGTNVLFTPTVNFTGTATIGYTITDNIGGTNSGLITVQVTNAPSAADVSLGVSYSGNDQAAELVATITVTNLGPATATGVVVSNKVPAGTSAGPAAGGTFFAGSVMLLNLGTLAPGQTSSTNVTFDIFFTGQLTNRFQVFADQADPVPANNTDISIRTVAQSSTTFTTSSAEYDTNHTAIVSLQVTNFSTELIARKPDGTVLYDQTFSNAFSDPAVQSAVTQAAGILSGAGLPSFTGPTQSSFLKTTNSTSVTVINSTNPTTIIGTKTWVGPVTNYVSDFGRISGYTFDLIQTNYALPIGGHPLTNVVPPGAIDIDTMALVIVTTNLTTTNTILYTNSSVYVMTGVVAQADLRLRVTESPNPVNVATSNLLTYSFTVSNAGPSAATGVTVSNKFFVLAGSPFIFDSASDGSRPTNGILLMNLGPLAAGATTNAQMTLFLVGNGDTPTTRYTNLFQVFADQIDPQPTNNFATVELLATNGNVTQFTTSTRTFTNNLTATVKQQTTNFSTELIAVMPGTGVVYDQIFNVPFADASVQTAVTTAAGNLTTAGATSYIGPGQKSLVQAFQNKSTLTSTNLVGTNIVVTVTAFVGPTNIFVGPEQSQPLALSAGQTDFDTLIISHFTNLITTTITSNYLNTAVYTMTGVVAQVDVALTLAASPNPVSVGSPLTYSLTVTNKTGATATGVVVSNTLPASVTFNSALPSQGSASNQANVVTYSVGSLPNGTAATLAIVVVPNAAGLLTNTARAFSTQTDSQPANNRATNVTTAVNSAITNLVLTVLSGITLNPLTGLFEQKVQVYNGGPATPSSVLVLVSGLAANAHLYNATGTTNGTPYVQSGSPLGIGSNVVFLLEYYVPTRVTPANLTFTVQAGPAMIPPVVTGTILNIDRTTVRRDGSVIVEFSTVPGQIYAVQYSSDMATWRTAVPAIIAPTSRVQWIDAGPPKTDSNPADQPARYYRAVLLPAH